MKKYYKSRGTTEMAIRGNLSQEVQEYIASADPLEIREEVTGTIEVDESGYVQEFESWEEVERYFDGMIDELKRLEGPEDEEN